MIGAISLSPSGNSQGGHRFLTLNTSKVVTRQSWDVLPMPQSVIDCVNFLGWDQPLLTVLTDRSGNVIGDDNPTYKPSASVVLDNHLPGEILPEAAPDPVDLTGVDLEDFGPPIDIPGVEPGDQPININDINVFGQQEPTLVELAQPLEPGQPPRCSQRQQKSPKNYVPSMSGKSYLYTQLGMTLLQDTRYRHSPDVVTAVLTQLSLKAALKQWGDDAKAAVEAEARQLHWRNSFTPVHWKDIVQEKCDQILESYVFVKKKHSGEIKARKVAGGNKQRDFIGKESASLPMVLTDAVLLTLIIDATEHRDVAIIDIPNAFIQTVVEDDKDKVIMRIS
jgi:hypothetical protein